MNVPDISAPIVETQEPKLRNDYAGYISRSIDYTIYKLKMANDRLENKDEKLRSYIDLNFHRLERVEKTFIVNADLYSTITSLTEKQYWLVLTEHWCGDAAQTLPALAKMAALSKGNIELRLLYRDQNPELMDANLATGKRAIPRLLQLDAELHCLNKWGPRPREAQALVEKLRSDPTTIDTYAKELHLWYARDRQLSLQREILQMLSATAKI